jgi:hypothetical protein
MIDAGVLSSDILFTLLSGVYTFGFTPFLSYCLLFLSFFNLDFRLLWGCYKHSFPFSYLVLPKPIDTFWSLVA